MSRKSTVADLQAEEASILTPLRRSSRRTSTTQETAPAVTTPARATRGRRLSAAQDNDDVIEVASTAPAAIGTRRTSQAEATSTPARATRGRRASAATQENEEVVEVKAAVVKPRRASILAEEESKPATPSRRGRKPSIVTEPPTEDAEVEKPKAVRGRRASITIEVDQTSLPVEKTASTVRGRRKSASVEPTVDVDVIEVPSKPPSRTTRRRTSTTADSTPAEEDSTRAKRTTRGRKNSEDVEEVASDKVATPARRATRGRKPSVTEESVEEPEKTTASVSQELKKPTAARTRRTSTDIEETSKISSELTAAKSEDSEPEILEMNFVDEINEVSEKSVIEDLSPTARSYTVLRLTPIKKKKLLEPLVNELDLSIINESVDDAEVSRQEIALEEMNSNGQQKESASDISPNNLETPASDKVSTTSGSSFASTTSASSFVSSTSTATSDVQIIEENSSTSSTLIAEPIQVNGDIPSPEKERLSFKSPRLNKSNEVLGEQGENSTKDTTTNKLTTSRRSRSLTPKGILNADRSRSNTPGEQKECLAVETEDKTSTPRRSLRLRKSDSPQEGKSENHGPDLSDSKENNEATESLKINQNTPSKDTNLVDKSLISDGSDGSFRFNLNMSLNNTTSGNQDKNLDLNDSKGSNDSNKENLNTSQIIEVNAKEIVDTAVSTVARTSNVFKPNQKDFSFCEPMDVDQSVYASMACETVNENDLSNIDESILENESDKTERSFLIQEETSVVFHIKSKSKGEKKSALGKPVETSDNLKDLKISPVNSFSKEFEKMRAEKSESRKIDYENQNIVAGDVKLDKLRGDDSFKVPNSTATCKVNETTVIEDSTCYDFEIPTDDEDDEFSEENKINVSKSNAIFSGFAKEEQAQQDISVSVKVDESTITGAACESTRYDFEVPPSDNDDELSEGNNLSPICNSKILNKSFDKRTDDTGAKYVEQNESKNEPSVFKETLNTPEKRKSKSPLASRASKSPKLDEIVDVRNNTVAEIHSDVYVIENGEESTGKSPVKTNFRRSSKRASRSPKIAGRSLNNTLQNENVGIETPLEGKVLRKSHIMLDSSVFLDQPADKRNNTLEEIVSDVCVIKSDEESTVRSQAQTHLKRFSKGGSNQSPLKGQDIADQNRPKVTKVVNVSDEETKSVRLRSSKSPRLSKGAPEDLSYKEPKQKDKKISPKIVKQDQNDLFDLDTDDENANEADSKKGSKISKYVQNDLFDEDTDPEYKSDSTIPATVKLAQNDLFDLDTDEETTTKDVIKALTKTKIKKEVNITPTSTKNTTSNNEQVPSIIIDEVEDPEPLSDNEEDNDSQDETDAESADEEDNAEENEFVIGMAEEGEEDTPSEGSNDIIDEGESIGSSDSEVVEDDDYENDSFVCDDEEQELLSGDEYDLAEDKKGKLKNKKSRIINVEEFDDDVINIPSRIRPKEGNSPKQRSRIIQVSDSSEDEADNKTENMETQTGREPHKNTSEIVTEEATVRETSDSKITSTDKSPKETNFHTNNELDLDFVEKQSDISISPNKFKNTESTLISLDSNVNTSINESLPKKRRKSSINIHESLVLDGSKEKLSRRINSLVETFCNSIEGEVSLNLSLEFEDKTEPTNKEYQDLVTPSKGINIISDIKITPGNKSIDDAEPSCSKDFILNNRKSESPKKILSNELTDISEEANVRKSKSPKKRISVTLDDLDVDLSSSPEHPSKKSRHSKSLDDVSQVSKNNKKLRKTRKLRKVKTQKLGATPSFENLKHTTFNLINDLVTDVRNRPRRTIKPTVPNTDFDSSWVTSSAKNVKPSQSPANHREKLELVSLKFHPKDFKNQTLADSKRVRRVETKVWMKKKGIF